MRRASLLAQLARGAARAAAPAGEAAGAQQQQQRLGGGALAFGARGMAGGPPPKIVPNPLQQVVPPIINGVKAGVDAVRSGVPAAATALLKSGAAQSAFAYFADNVLFTGALGDVKDLDLAKWAAWLHANNYGGKDGWARVVAGVRARLPALTPAEVSALVPVLHARGLYDRALFEGFAATVKARFTEFETPDLVKIAAAFAENDHFDLDLFDDVADSIAYCNHYLAPTATPLPDIARCFEAYAKFGHDRGDLFVVLARAVHEGRLKELPDADLRATAVGLLASFSKLHFWPDCTEALLVHADLKPGAFQGGDRAVIDEAAARVRAAAGGSLPWLDGGWKDWEHFHGRPFGSYNLWVARDELFGKYYSPASAKAAAPAATEAAN